MKLFIAVELSEEIKDALCDTIDSLRRQRITGNFAYRENLHLTTVNSFELKLEGTGFFGNLLWAGIADNETLDRLASDLAAQLRAAGFDIENRSFIPHITLARKLQDSTEDLNLWIKDARMTVRSISLMRSDRINGRQIYTRVYSRDI